MEGRPWRCLARGLLSRGNQDLLENKERVRVYTVKEVKEPFEIVFPLRGADLKTARPDEEEIEETEPLDLSPDASKEDAPVKRPRKVSTRPHYIDSQAWVMLWYPRRQAIHWAETEMAEREAGRSHVASSGGDADNASPGER